MPNHALQQTAGHDSSPWTIACRRHAAAEPGRQSARITGLWNCTAEPNRRALPLKLSVGKDEKLLTTSASVAENGGRS